MEEKDSSSFEDQEALRDVNVRCFLYVIIRLIGADSEPAVIEQLSDVLKTVLDAERFDRLDKDRFLAAFYDHYIHWILVAFASESNVTVTATATAASKTAGSKSADSSSTPSHPVPAWIGCKQGVDGLSASRRCLCEIFALCVQGHSYRMKYFVMRNNVIGKVPINRHTYLHKLQ
jgi:protein phosphatase-4 regulatory subunit 3